MIDKDVARDQFANELADFIKSAYLGDISTYRAVMDIPDSARLQEDLHFGDFEFGYIADAYAYQAETSEAINAFADTLAGLSTYGELVDFLLPRSNRS